MGNNQSNPGGAGGLPGQGGGDKKGDQVEQDRKVIWRKVNSHLGVSLVLVAWFAMALQGAIVCFVYFMRCGAMSSSVGLFEEDNWACHKYEVVAFYFDCLGC